MTGESIFWYCLMIGINCTLPHDNNCVPKSVIKTFVGKNVILISFTSSRNSCYNSYIILRMIIHFLKCICKQNVNIERVKRER